MPEINTLPNTKEMNNLTFFDIPDFPTHLDKEEDYQILLKHLDTLKDNLKQWQTQEGLFVRVDLLKRLLLLLDVSYSPNLNKAACHEPVCIVILDLISRLLSLDKLIQEQFTHALHGYQEIKTRLESSLDLHNNSTALLCILKMMCYPEDLDRIYNTDAFEIISDIFQTINAQNQALTLQTLLHLTGTHISNLIYLQESSILQILLKRVIPFCKTEDVTSLAIQVTERLAIHSCSVSDMKAILACMSVHKEEYFPGEQKEGLPPHFDKLLEMLPEILMDDVSGTQLEVFDFWKESSRMDLPVIPKWPSGGGFTFLIWFRTHAGSTFPNQNQTLWSMFNSQLQGVELVITESKVSFSVQKETKRELMLKASFDSNGWNFIGISQSSPKFWNASAETIVCLNDSILYKGKHEYPEPVCIDQARVGGFTGLIGNIVLIEEALSSSSILQMNGIKSSTGTSFLSRKRGSLFDLASSPNTLTFHYKASGVNREKTKCLDLSNNTFDCRLQHINSFVKKPSLKSLEAVGGAMSLVPLLSYVKMPYLNGDTSRINTELICQRINIFFSILIEATLSSDQNSQLFIDNHGPQILSIIIRHLQLVNLGSGFLIPFLRFRQAAPDDLKKLLDDNILFHADLWSNMASDSFTDYTTTLSGYYETMSTWKKTYPVEYWIRVLERYHGFSTSPGSPDFSSTLVLERRKLIFELLPKLLLWDTESRKSICNCLIQSLWVSNDSQHLLDLLNWIKSMKTGSKDEQSLFLDFLAIAGTDLFYDLLGRELESIRIFGLDFLWLYCQAPSRSPLKIKFNQDFDVMFDVILDRLRLHTVSELILHRLVSLAFDNALVSSLSDWTNVEDLSSAKINYLYLVLHLIANSEGFSDLSKNIRKGLIFNLQSFSNDLFWSDFDDFQTTLVSMIDKIDSNDWKLSVELIAHIILARLLSDSHTWVDVESFVLSTMENFQETPAMASLWITHLFETIISTIMASISAEKEQHYPLAIVQKILQFCLFFLFHDQDLYHIVRSRLSSSDTNSKSLLEGIINHKRFPLESNPGLTTMILELTAFLLEAKYAVQLRLRDDSIPMSDFIQFIEASGLKLAVNGLETWKSACWTPSLRYLTLFSTKRANYADHEEADVDEAMEIALAQSFQCLFKSWRDKLAKTDSYILETTTQDPKTVKSYLTEGSWPEFYNNVLFPAVRSKEEQGFVSVKKTMKELLSGWDRDKTEKVIGEQAKKKSVEDICKSILSTKVHAKDDHRRHLYEQVQTEMQNRKSFSTEWNQKLESFTHERGLWRLQSHTLQLHKDPSFWLLDPYENDLRMRRRLQRNMLFDDHAEASTKRDRVELKRSSSMPLISEGEIVKAHARIPSDQKPSKLEKFLLRTISRLESDASFQSSDYSLDGEDWNVIQSDEVQSQKAAYSTEAELISQMLSIKGRFHLTKQQISFFPDDRDIGKVNLESSIPMENQTDSFQWPLDEITQIHLRRYKLRNSALEFFLRNGCNYLIHFPGSSSVSGNKERVRIMKKIASLKPANLVFATSATPLDVFSKSTLTQRWQRHEISNFEYIMALNTVSGRTYNDLTQYPIFPWILKDYTSTSLNFNDLNIYRDLSKPIGALEEKRLKQILERYRTFEDPTGFIKKFHYGSHYSSSASVIFYLLRLEPFTKLHIELQGGKFDHPDRQFHSIASCWNSVMTVNGDFKELIPEFFYLPEFLSNENKFDLGVRQDDAKVDHVILPPWASSPEEFIRLHRQALESEYVSDHLHQWIDLIWGYKQRGEEAVRAHNVFYFLTYEGAIKIDSIKDPIQKQSIEDQINNFGQTPSQLLTKPHPKRFKREDWIGPNLFSAYDRQRAFDIPVGKTSILMTAPVELKTGMSPFGKANVSFGNPITFEKFLSIDQELVFGIHSWNAGGLGTTEPFTSQIDSRPATKRKLPVRLSHPSSQSFALDQQHGHLFVSNCYDDSFKIISISDPVPVIMDSISGGHVDIITCIVLASDGKTLVTGSRDATVIVWEVNYIEKIRRSKVDESHKKILQGHDHEVTAIAVDTDHDVVVSGSMNGVVLVHSLFTGLFIRTLAVSVKDSLEKPNISHIVISRDCHLVVASRVNNSGQGWIHVYSLNGKLLAERAFKGHVNDMKSSLDGAFLIVALDHGDLLLLQTHSLETVYMFDLGNDAGTNPVTSLWISSSQCFLQLGRRNGNVTLLTMDLLASPTRDSKA